MNNSTLQSLQEKVRGTVITPDHDGYDLARAVYNGMIDKRPAAVLQVSQVADVISAVSFARDAGMDVALRGGGHSAPASAPAMAGW
jgi:FAD/FMN-containing dehydrogenase